MRNVGGEHYFGHMGDTRGFFAGFLADSKEGNGVVIFTNTHTSPELIREITKAVGYVYGWKGIVKDPIKVLEVPAEKLEQYAGKYKTGFDNALNLSYENGDLIYSALNEKMYCVATDTFKLKRRLGFISFIRKNNGEIDGVSYIVADELGRMPSAPYGGKRLQQSELLPSELLLTNNYMEAIKEYKAIFEQNNTDRTVSEMRFNRLGYNLLQQGYLQSALAIFKLNTELYPKSWNCFDSYGEALAIAGKLDEAIESYKEAIRLNPAALNSKDRLEALLQKK